MKHSALPGTSPAVTNTIHLQRHNKPMYHRKHRRIETHHLKTHVAPEMWLSSTSKYLLKLYEVKWKCQSLSCVPLFVTPWTIAHQALLSMELSRQEYWSRLPFPSPGDLPNPGTEFRSPALQGDSLPFEPYYLLKRGSPNCISFKPHNT